MQGGTISFLVPTLAILNLPQWQCPPPEILDQMSHENRTELWQVRMRELSGAIAVSAVFQIVVGFGGGCSILLFLSDPIAIVIRIVPLDIEVAYFLFRYYRIFAQVHHSVNDRADGLVGRIVLV